MARPSVSQLDTLVELCTRARVDPRSTAHRFFDTHPRHLSAEQVSTLCRVLHAGISVGTYHSSDPLDALAAHAAGRPFSKQGAFMNAKPIIPPARGQDPVEWACDLLGVTNRTDSKCPTCGGKGTVTDQTRPTMTALQKTIRDQENASIVARDAFARSLTDPRLHTVTHVAQLLAGPDGTPDLNTATEFLTVLAHHLT